MTKEVSTTVSANPPPAVSSRERARQLRERALANPAFTQRIWKPGQSGNPCGAIGEWQRCRALCRENSADAAAEIIRLYKESDDDRVRFMSAQWVYARAWGEKEPAFDPNAEPPPALFDAGKPTPQQ